MKYIITFVFCFPLSLLLHSCAPLAYIPAVLSGIETSKDITGLSKVEKTKTHPISPLYKAAIKSLRKMGCANLNANIKEKSRTITASADNRNINIQLNEVTEKLTRLSVTVADGYFYFDKSTADEIIQQIEKTLEENNNKKLQQKAMLLVIPKPNMALIRIMNIKPKFFQGIELLPGKYRLEISAHGYKTEDFWITLDKGEDRILTASLTKK